MLLKSNDVSLVKVGCWVSRLLLTFEWLEKRHICPNDKVFGVFTALPNRQIYFQAHVNAKVQGRKEEQRNAQ